MAKGGYKSVEVLEKRRVVVKLYNSHEKCSKSWGFKIHSELN